MLRSLLFVVVLLLPCVTALPSGVRDAERAVRMEAGSAERLSESLGARQIGQVDSNRLAVAHAQPGHLDRDRAAASTGKQRIPPFTDAQGIVTEPRQRRDEIFPAVVAVNSTLAPTSSEDAPALTIVFETANGTESNVALAPPSKRWGQTATYLPTHNVILVVGGQTSLSGEITNDVYALDVADMSAASIGSNSSAQSWQRLSSDGLPAHAFAAASSVVDPTDGVERLWIVGGVTQNCALDAPAYVWSAPVGNVTAGKWEAVYTDNGVVPRRRRGAKAVTVTAGNSTSIMVSGGSYDASTCETTNGSYMGVDMWTLSSASSSSSSSTTATMATSETAHVGIDITGTAYAAVQSLALDPRMRGFSLTDYTTVTLPANGTCGEKVLFLGGQDERGRMAPLDRFWVLDTATGDWEHWNATGLIPAGRMAHTAVATADRKVIIHGGYLQDPARYKTDNEPLSEVFILDPSQTPARWDAAVWTSESSRPPQLAYHSAVMADDVMLVSFGRVSDGPAASYAGQSFLKASSSDSQVHYLDTSTMQSAGGLTWSTSTAGVAQARQAVANSASAAAAASAAVAPIAAEQAAPVTAPATSPAAQVAPVEASPAVVSPPVEPSPDAAAPAPAKASTEVDHSSPATAKVAPSSDTNTAPPTNSSHTGAIAGSLLGAAAIAAAIGGIYAYRKRKEAAAYNLGRADPFNGGSGGADTRADLARFHANVGGGADEEKGPYVSSLYLQPEEMRDVPLAAGAAVATAGAGGWSARLKRAASTLTKPHAAAGEDRYTAAPKPVITLRNGTPSRNAADAAELPDDFIASLVADDEPLGRGDLLLPTHGGERKLTMHPNASRASLASLASVSSLESGAAASHFSYPYLAAMHRGASPLSYNGAESGVHRVRVILGTPESCYDQMRMSPGDVVSPFHLPNNPHTSPESLFLDFDPSSAHAKLDDEEEDSDDLDTTVAMDGVSVVAAGVHTPVFPWSTPAIAAPPPAKINTASASMLRSQRTGLRVTNAC